jgi:hypothetical protein
MRTELITHLKNVSDHSFIGFCIQQILLREGEELQTLLKELTIISREHPGVIVPIIGEEAHALLMG